MHIQKEYKLLNRYKKSKCIERQMQPHDRASRMYIHFMNHYHWRFFLDRSKIMVKDTKPNNVKCQIRIFLMHIWEEYKLLNKYTKSKCIERQMQPHDRNSRMYIHFMNLYHWRFFRDRSKIIVKDTKPNNVKCQIWKLSFKIQLNCLSPMQVLSF